MTADDLPVEFELVQPVASVSGVTMYSRVTRQTRPGAVDAEGQPVRFGGVPLVIEVDAAGNEQRRSARSDGGTSHLIRQTVAPVTTAPSGYFLTEAMPATTKHRFVRDEDGHLIGAEVEHGPPRKQQTGFGVS
ncbi:MAG: hypothetical protein ACXVFE_03565 [Gaiellaceae bacterium]